MPGPVKKKSPFDEQLAIILENQKTQDLRPEQLNAFKTSNAIFLSHYQYELARINPATFEFLNDQQKAQLRDQLQHTLSVLTIQLLIDNMDKRRYRKKALDDAIAQCQAYQLQLEGQPPIENAPPATALPMINAAASPVKYLWLSFATWLAKQFNYIPDGNTAMILNWIGHINVKWRLYWVWSGGLLRTILDAIPQDFFNNTKAQWDLKVPARVLGYLSWAIYYFRFGLNLFLFIKHSLPGKWSWMSEEEKQLSVWERAKAQWNQRKFILLNDLAWGTVGLLCFSWLIGSSSMIYAGNVLTAGLLVIDILLTCWRFFEAQAQFQQAEVSFNEKLSHLDDEEKQYNYELTQLSNRRQAGCTLSDDELNKEKQAREQLVRIQRQRAELMYLLKTNKTNWHFKRASIMNDLAYSCGLLVGWSLIGGVTFPPSAVFAAQSTIMALGLAASVYCFVITVAYHAINCGLEIAKIRKMIRENDDKISQLQTQLDALDPTQQQGLQSKQLFVEIKSLEAENRYQKRMISHQKLKLLRATLIDALIPAVIFASLVFLPTGIGVGILAAALALIVISKLVLNQFEPKPEPKPEFVEADYNRNRSRFFSTRPEQHPEEVGVLCTAPANVPSG